MSDQRVIVVVGADEGATSGLASVLRTLGVVVRTARDSAGLIAGEPASVVIVHGAPADRGALELARALRVRRGSSCPRLVWIPAGEPRRVDLVQFDDVVRRPYRAVDLLERVRRHLRASGAYSLAREVRSPRTSPAGKNQAG